MTKNIIIYLLILIIILTLILFLFYENFRYDELLEIKESQLESELKYLENLSLLTENYNELEKEYQELYQKSKDSYIKWQEFEVTSYTSNECGTVTYSGFELDKNYSKYLNVCAVDPLEIKLGSIVLVKFKNGEIKPYIALDTGGAIKGKRVDLYFTDLNEAINFGRQQLEVSILE